MEINISQIIAAMINFVILYFILRRFLFKPVNNLIETRKNELEDAYKVAEKNKNEAEIIKSESNENLKKSKKEGKLIVEEYKRNAENVYSEIIENANNEAKDIIERSKLDAKREKEKIENEIKTQIFDLSLAVSKKALERSISEELHIELIDEFITKVGN